MTRTEQDILFYAFRYALGRRTGVVSFMVGQIKNKWHDLHPNTQNQIQREILERKNDGGVFGGLGDKCDIDSWQEVLDLEPDKDV